MQDTTLLRPLIIGLLSIVVMSLLWFVQKRTRDAGIVDVAWAGGLGVAAIFYAAVGEGDESRRILLALLGGVWGLRLAFQVLWRSVHSDREDGRYLTLRERWGDRFDQRIFWFFQAQAILVALLSWPFLLASIDERSGLHLTDFLAAALWITGLVGEWTADHQLARFKRNPKNRGKTCREGLWRYSRHPNYFFEWLIWCSFAVLALPSPLGWTALFAPLLMLLLILKVTGIPPTEAQAVKSRGDDYRQYQRTTSAFVPWPPKRSPNAEDQ